MNTLAKTSLAILSVSLSFGTTFAAVGDYAEVPCAATYFTSNGCNQCFEGGKISVGKKISGLYDSWESKNANGQLIYRDEQTYPEMINLGGPDTSFSTNPSDPKLFWKYGIDVAWIDSATGSGRQEFVLESGKKVTFMEGELGAAYALEKTNKKDGEPVGLLKFPLNVRDLNENGQDGEKKTHNECVLYKAEVAAAVATPVTTTVEKPTAKNPQTKEITKVKTGPETAVLFLLTISLGLVIALILRRRQA